MRFGNPYFKIYYLTLQNCRKFFVYIFGLKAETFLIKQFYRLYILKYEFLNKSKQSKRGSEDGWHMDFLSEKKPEILNSVSRKNQVTIVIPVFNAYTDLKACLNSVINQTTCPYQLLIIDDGSTDYRIRQLINTYTNIYSNITSIFNDKNLGYTATINRGCQIAGSNDVVLLNSDTQVTYNWLNKLYDCAKSEGNVATVTPLSNAAGVFSIPQRNMANELPDWISIDEMRRLVENLSMKLRPRVPTGNGFCMYITRSALEIVGGFDEKNFPRGYGEENDFCMRARKKGFIHLIEDSTYIYHKKSASFSGSKEKIIPGCIQRLNLKHPEYQYLIMKWLMKDPLDGFRAILQENINCMVQSHMDQK